MTQRGGLYNGDASSTSSGPTDVYTAGGDPSDLLDVIGQNIPNSAFVKDDLIVENITLLDFPIGMPGLSMNTYYNTQAVLGLGPNSTILNALLTTGKIASRSYSWWWGLTGATEFARMDGQMVLGGYDAAKIRGKNYTQTLSEPTQACHSGMIVTISDIGLGFPNGTIASITSPVQVTACILPYYPLILTLPWDPFYDNFEAHTHTRDIGAGGGDGLTFNGMLYEKDSV